MIKNPRPTKWLRLLFALAAALPILGFSFLIASLGGNSLAEDESGLDRISNGYTIWGFSVSIIAGVLGIALFRKIMGWSARSLWLLLGCVYPLWVMIALAFTTKG